MPCCSTTATHDPSQMYGSVFLRSVRWFVCGTSPLSRPPRRPSVTLRRNIEYKAEGLMGHLLHLEPGTHQLDAGSPPLDLCRYPQSLYTPRAQKYQTPGAELLTFACVMLVRRALAGLARSKGSYKVRDHIKAPIKSGGWEGTFGVISRNTEAGQGSSDVGRSCRSQYSFPPIGYLTLRYRPLQDQHHILRSTSPLACSPSARLILADSHYSIRFSRLPFQLFVCALSVDSRFSLSHGEESPSKDQLW